METRYWLRAKAGRSEAGRSDRLIKSRAEGATIAKALLLAALILVFCPPFSRAAFAQSFGGSNFGGFNSNRFHRPTPTPTPVATATPTPSNVGNEITITSPVNGQTVSGGAVAVTVALGPDVYWDQLMVDGTSVASASGNFTWDSTTVANGQHTLTVRVFQQGGSTPIGTASVSVQVNNPTSTPTPTPTPTSTTAALPQTITITAPTNGATITTDTAVVDNNSTSQCGGLSWYDVLYVDGQPTANCAFSACVFSPSAFATGSHSIQIHAHTANSPNPGHECATSQTVTVTVGLGQLTNLPPGASLPSDSTCVSLANQANFPETTSDNVNDGTGWDANNQIWTTPSYFYANAGARGQYEPSADYTRVDGAYSGTTQDIIRWAACKWGVNEDWAYAESAEENYTWTNACAELHGGITCAEGGDCGNPDADSGGETANLSFLGIPVTNSASQFTGTNGIRGTNTDGASCSSNWASYGIIQNKVDAYEWFTWPMAAVSTAWNEDYRWAKWRSCVNGNLVWFQGNPDYTNAVSRAKSNPNGLVPSGQTGPTNLFTNETNLQYLALGCVATHFSGGWYDSAADGYLTSSSTGFIYHLNNKVWPGGRG